MTAMMLLMTMTSIMFTMSNHPMSMGFILIMQTLMASIITGMMINSFWFSYMLFIIMLGGMLVLFIYMSSIASNEKFHMSNKMIMLMMVTMLIMPFMLIITENYNIMTNNMEKKMLKNDQLMTLTKMFSTKSATLTMMMILYLLITMIAITTIVNVFEGPMRMKN
uniref:NADH-ubiquinone oxidoreductase chain 6 n=1 Tax=Nerthra indica TaxID=1249914 RepID=C5HIM1_9HEMI|nr:NADH dehydrogenase subunit 6 [Nerthra indica]ACJ69466.1 NADH dehydrogenase subunit 6 [Nerthra indica]